MKKSITIFLFFLVMISIFIACTTNEDNSNDGTYMTTFSPKKATKDCKRIVEEFESDTLVKNITGRLVVVGNEPFTKLKFKTKNEKDEEVIYQIVEECSDDLWDLQNIEIQISGKVKEAYLEMVTGQKMLLLTLYPTEVYRKIKVWGD